MHYEVALHSYFKAGIKDLSSKNQELFLFFKSSVLFVRFNSSMICAVVVDLKISDISVFLMYFDMD